MSDQAIDSARAAVLEIPLFRGIDIPAASIRRLGGLTNLVFAVTHHDDHYVLRLPGKGTEEYINRANEAQAAAEAARAGVSPEVLFADPATGVMVTRLVAGAVTMSPEKFKSIAGAPARAGEVFRRLHQSGATFKFRFELFSMIDEYLKVLATKKMELPAGYHEVVREAETVRAALAAHPLPLAACHCDPLCENFLDAGERMWLVDWEYSGMNDPMWDLGDLAVEGQFTAQQEEEMIRAYFGGEPSPHDRGRIVIYKAMCDLLWTLWGLIQHASQNPADDFWAYAVNRFERCKSLMSTPAFAEHVKAVARG
ncbi:LPS biosynthesis choline kinase [Aestuariivirga litoralis]|uniref:LPS biosynthesis choline kinase n=1 Tax=Aestuariivirga litoralis TaxID=2650924 RepID=A0A2W2B5I0_9HYPH|nr:choline kinase family protein [Aestuariivirga litoralis]PZF75378.1 LPS biosynthesis choline kinase [Aestuariivirga litoralis]